MYVITGATGNTGSAIAQHLLAQGKTVRVVSRSLDRLRPLAAHGAELFPCDLADTVPLIRAFDGAEAVYAMIPPNQTASDVQAAQERVSDSFADALARTKVPYAVVLSSIGADKSSGTGPVTGLHRLEHKLSRIAGLNTLYLRAGYFMENTLAQADIISQTGHAAGPLHPDLKFPMIATRDIAAAASDELARLAFRGHQTRELLGPRDYAYRDIAAVIGKAIGQPNLQYVQMSAGQFRSALTGMGMSASMAEALGEMSEALNSGRMRALESRSPGNTTPTTYETFVAEEFVPAYRRKSAA
jgi:uncharacterized protein YbjT (DUF2867 family)